jgi:hypothetical protein
MSERDAFGPSLKAERDRRGIPLQAIADSTKIGISLLAALERNDVSRWPKGIFRRSFVREYVAALGLPPEPFVAEFVRLFPDDGPCPCPDDPYVPYLDVADAEATEFRLTLEGGPSATWRTVRTRALIAGIEASVVLAVGSIFAWMLGTPVWSASGILALIYYPLASVFLERTPTPHLVFQPTGVVRLLHAASRSLRQLRLQRRPAPPASDRSPIIEEMDATPTTTASEWRTASN